MLARSPPAQTPGALVAPCASVCNSTPSAASADQRRKLGILADRADDGVGVEREIAARHRRHRELTATRARFEVHAHAVQAQRRAVLGNAAQHRAVAQCDALLARLEHLLALRRHVRFGLERQDRHVMAGAACAARDVQRRAAAADHDHVVAQRRRGASAAAGQVVGAVDDPGAAVVQLRQALLAPRADRQVDRVVAGAKACQILGRGQRLAAAHVDTERQDARDLAVEHAARQAVGRDAVAHQAAEFGLRLEQRDARSRAGAAETRPTGRRARRRPPRRCARARALAAGTASPARAPCRRRSARACRSTATRRSRRGCRRSRKGGGRCDRQSTGNGLWRVSVSQAAR